MKFKRLGNALALRSGRMDFGLNFNQAMEICKSVINTNELAKKNKITFDKLQYFQDGARDTAPIGCFNDGGNHCLEIYPFVFKKEYEPYIMPQRNRLKVVIIIYGCLNKDIIQTDFVIVDQFSDIKFDNYIAKGTSFSIDNTLKKHMEQSKSNKNKQSIKSKKFKRLISKRAI